MNPDERLRDVFFGTPALLQASIISLCQSNTHQCVGGDTISHVIGIMLSSPLDIQLVSNGLQIFKDKEVLYPYQYMTPPQREFLLDLMRDEPNWRCYDHCITYKRSTAQPTILDPLLVLQALCEIIQRSKKYPDARHRLAIMNITLQKVHHKVAVSKPVQAALNKFLYDQK
jgi:hypothetical protein